MPFPVFPSTKTPFLCSKDLKMRVPDPKSAQKCRFCARGWLPRAQQRPPELSTARHKPFGVHLAAVRQATDCRNLPRNLSPCMLPKPTAVHTAATCCQDLPAAHTTVHTAVALPPRNYRRATYRRVLPPGILPCILPQPTCRGILPRDGSRAQRAGDSDVGANDQGAGDDPGDGVDAH